MSGTLDSSSKSRPQMEVPPTLPAAAVAASPAGASAFVSYWWDVFNYSHRSRSSELLTALSDSGCTFCSSVIHEIDLRRQEGSTFEGYQVVVKAAVAAPGDVRQGIITNTELGLSEGRIVGRDGAILKTFPAQPELPCDLGPVSEVLSVG
ncbi:MAG TPA: DUF6318 family protein [Kineosporiaceae bacterium]|nr:DUF6318 family protein [Kineosporiaceae bacterium]